MKAIDVIGKKVKLTFEVSDDNTIQEIEDEVKCKVMNQIGIIDRISYVGYEDKDFNNCYFNLTLENGVKIKEIYGRDLELLL